MKKAKVITMCGSLKYMNKIMEHSEKLQLEGNCVLSIIYPTHEDKDHYTDEQVDLLDILHKQKIDMSDAIFVVNVNGYIGNSTRSEIEYAVQTGKEVIYLEPLK